MFVCAIIQQECNYVVKQQFLDIISIFYLKPYNVRGRLAVFNIVDAQLTKIPTLNAEFN